MDFFKHDKEKHFDCVKIKKVQWNNVGGCLEWILDDDDWIKFRQSGTEPKFKVYYNFNNDTLINLNKKYQSLHSAFEKLIEE